MGKFAIDNSGNRAKDLKNARRRIALRNKGRDFKDNQQVLKSVRQAPSGKTLGGVRFPKGSHLIVTTRKSRRGSK